MQKIDSIQEKDNILSGEAIRERDRKFVCHPWSPISTDRSSLTLSRGEGYKVWDINDNCYIDCCSLNSTCGYANNEIAFSVYEQLLKFHGTDLSLGSHKLAGELAEKLASFLPKDLSRTLFVNSGSEGIEAAIFIAGAYWEQIGQQRFRLISFANGYHGSTHLTRSITKLPNVVQPFGPPILSSFVELPAATKDIHKPEALKPLLNGFERALKESDTLPMAVVIEPLLNVGGGIQLPNGFLTGLRKLCDETGALLILDEVFTAFARTGKMFAFQHENMSPDILVSSKGLASGYMPITAVTMKEEIYKTFSKDKLIGGMRYGHTTSAHAAACAAALTTLHIIDRDNLCKNAEKLGEYLRNRFLQFIGKGDVIDVRGIGLILIIELSSYEAGNNFKKLAQEKGLLVRQSSNSIKITPPLTVDSNGIDEISSIIADCLKVGKFI